MPHEHPPIDATAEVAARQPADSSRTLSPAETPPVYQGGVAVPGYEILGELGRGGMGVVYRARQTHLHREVALKMILSGGHAADEDRQRFLAEAEAVAAVQHPGIVQVFDFGTHEGLPYFALEYCSGGSLADRLRANPLPPREAAHVVEQVARAMQAAHGRGVVHRDLKPANVLLAADGTSKVTDFGLAKRIEGDSGLTRTGAVMGTPSYMAPEQAEGKKGVGPAADVWAMGAMLYECLTGRPPFLAATIFDLLSQVIADEPVPPTRLVAKVPRDLETICLKCLHKSPERRYASAAELADDLARWRDGEPILARPAGGGERAVKWARRRPTVAALAALSVVAVLALVSITVVALQAVRRADRAQLDRELAQRKRTLAQIDALRTASPGEVPSILKGLRESEEEVIPRVRELYATENSRAGRMRLALALASEEEGVCGELARWMRQADDPAEVLLARDALLPRAGALREGLWATAEDADAPHAERFRALVALAAYDPDSPKWKESAAVGIEQLLSANPLHLGMWVQGLRPVRLALIKPLGEVFRGKNLALATQKQVAAQVLADYAADRPEVLADLLLDSDPKQYALLLPVLERYRDRATRRMRAELSTQPDYWQDAPPDSSWKGVPAELRRVVENASGLLADRWALCQSLPLARLAGVTEGLRPCGYRPVRVRPWRRGDETLAAVVWTRDGRAWKLETGLTAAELEARDAEQGKAGLVAEDVAGYETREGDRYAVLWRKGDEGEKTALYVGVPAAEHLARTNLYKAKGMVPSTIQSMPGDGGRYAAVWWKGEKKSEGWNLFWDNAPRDHADKVAAGEKLLLDVDIGPARPVDAPRPGWQADLERAEANVRKDPKDGDAVWSRALALVRLGRDADALAGLDATAKSFPAFAQVCRERAMLHARAGRAGEARGDLEEYGKRGGDGVVMSGAQVAFYLGEPDAPKTLEEEVRSNPADASLAYDAARVYAIASRWERVRRVAWAAALAGSPNTTGLLVAPPDRSGEYAARALALLRQAHTRGFAGMSLLRTDADLESIRDLPGFRELLTESGLLRAYASVWRDDPTREASGAQGLSPEAHLAECRARAAAGWRPVGLSLASIPGEAAPVAASAWQRPVRFEEREAITRKRAIASATLLRMKDAGPPWALFRQDPDPTARSYLSEACAQRGVDARLLVQRLEREKDTSARRALIVALGDYTAKELPADVRDPLVKGLLGWYRDDPDAGIHGAIDWLLRNAKEGPTARPLDWGQAKELERIDDELATKASLAPSGPGVARGWRVNGQGQTFTRFRGPVEFRMGSPPSDPDYHASQKAHVRRIARNFEIGTKPVTVAQWGRFLKARPAIGHTFTKRYSPEQGTPILSVTMYEAMTYCNWLSEAEGIPKEQWCYPEKIAAGMKPLPDSLKRTGYRLPTEGEWEYACRAESSSGRYYGTPTDLLGRYAWYQGNSTDRTWPVGQKRPNDWGLFDMHGNVWAWCQDHYLNYPSGGVDDKNDNNPIRESGNRVLRGGAFSSSAQHVRSPFRNVERPGIRFDSIGLRLSRTCH